MKSDRKGPELRKLLDTCADLRQIRSKMSDPELERESRTRLRRQSKRKTEQLERDLKSFPFRGPLAEVVQSFPLAPDHFQILAVLLQRQMRCEDPCLEGRLILAAIFESSYDVLARVDLLTQDSPIRAAGLVVLDDEEDSPVDLLEARFALSEEGLEFFRQEIAGVAARPVSVPPADEAYQNNRELLVDLRVIHNLYRLRAERVFSAERWNRLHSSSYQPGRTITERISAHWKRLRARLANTPHAAKFPGVRLMREYALGEDEMVVVIHLLFKELYEGNAYADLVELLRLVSTSEPELIQNRRLAADNAPLIKNEILNIEPMLENRSLTGEAHLADWVVNYLFGATSTADIRPDERIEWHRYLAELDDTQGFFRDMDVN